jgi:hypothetical protein
MVATATNPAAETAQINFVNVVMSVLPGHQGWDQYPSADVCCFNAAPEPEVKKLFQNATRPFTRRSATLRDRAALFNPRAYPMTMTSRVIATVAASLLLAGTAFAQTTAPAAKPAAAPASKMAPAAKMEKPRTAASLECSKEADAKGLHGKERKKFRSECKAKAAKSAKTN